MVTVGSFHAGTKHNIISDEATLLLTVRSYTDETRRILLDGIKRIVRGEAIAAGMPEDRMPVVTMRDRRVHARHLQHREADGQHRGPVHRSASAPTRVERTPAVMGGEDFSRFWLADKSIESLIFWVGGVPKAKWDAAGGDPAKLPSPAQPLLGARRRGGHLAPRPRRW